MSILSGRMDGQQEREAALTTESVEEILRPLVEATVQQLIVPDDLEALPKSPGDGLEEALATPHLVDSVVIPDPRFDALRLRCPMLSGGFFPWSQKHGRIDASLGAITWATAAFGLDVVELFQWPGGAWTCYLRHFISVLPSDPPQSHGSGASPEEGLARALVAAWRDEQEAR